MAASARPNLSSVVQGFAQLPLGRKLTLLIALAFTIAVSIGVMLWAKAPEYRVLYGNLAEADGGAVLAELQRQNVPYKMADGGGAILVPAEQVYDLRLKLASQGLPRGGAVGFELLENQKLGTSQFVEQVNYQRALAGELARSIQALGAVESARVHLAIPKPSVFLREQQPPSAAVLVRLFPGRVLDAGQVAGIVHLVSGSVPGLPAANITVVDQAGSLLSAATRGMAGLNSSQLDYVRDVEKGIAERIERILLPLVGPGNARAQVSAALDFAENEQTAETFKPNARSDAAALRSQQSVETAEGADKAGGVPGALSNQPPGAASAPLDAGASATPGAAAGGESKSLHKETTVNYELDKTIRHTREAPGRIQRLNAAVVVNQRTTRGKDGKAVSQPLPPAEMAQITGLVKEAMGFDAARGDSVNVMNAAFVTPEAPAEVPLYQDPQAVSQALTAVKYLLVALVLLALVFAVLRPLIRGLAQMGTSSGGAPLPLGTAAALPAPGTTAAGGASQAAALPGVPSNPALPAPSRASNYEENLKAAREIARQDPKAVAGVVKGWVSGHE